MSEEKEKKTYRGRLAPTPSGYLHSGHANTFRIAWERAQANEGILVFRNDDLDPLRCKPEFTKAAMDDLKGIGLSWSEGPDCGGSSEPYDQSRRGSSYLAVLYQLAQEGHVYPCRKSRKEIRESGKLSKSGEEYLFPEEFKPEKKSFLPSLCLTDVNWRFRVREGQTVSFLDQAKGMQEFKCGLDFSDFLVWRKDEVSSYELASVVDDHAMDITEVVRGEDLLLSSARQCLIFDAMGWRRPKFYHCRLLLDEKGHKLSKSERSLPRIFSPA